MSSLQWYVLRAVSGQEKKVKGYLDKEIEEYKVQDFIPQVLIPTEKVLEVKKVRKKAAEGGIEMRKVPREKILYPGYIVIQADLDNLTVKHIISAIPGILGFLGSEKRMTMNSKPAPLHPTEVARMLNLQDERASSEASIQVSFLQGESVKIIEGAFESLTGTVSKILEDKRQLEVVIKIFSHEQTVALSFTQVEKIVE